MMKPMQESEAEEVFRIDQIREDYDHLELDDDGDDDESVSLNEMSSSPLEAADPSKALTPSASEDHPLSSFDPYSPDRINVPQSAQATSSLFDKEERQGITLSTTTTRNFPPGGAGLLEMEEERQGIPLSRTTTRNIPGAAGLLEMEEVEEAPQTTTPVEETRQKLRSVEEQQQRLLSSYEPIQTSSGLLLTHRRAPDQHSARMSSRRTHLQGEDYDVEKKHRSPFLSSPVAGLKRNLYKGGMEMDKLSYEGPSSFLHHTGRLLSVVRLWVIASAIILLAGTGLLLKHVRHERTAATQGQSSSSTIQLYDQEAINDIPERVVLLPLPVMDEQGQNGLRRRLGGTEDESHSLWDEFEAWVERHSKVYHTTQEKEHRFKIWSHNHHRTAVKNERHGPCKLTGKNVFGSNHLKDLTHEEFKARYLTGYTGPRADEQRKSRSAGVLGPHISTSRHPKIHQRILQQQRGGYAATGYCDWYDISCILRYIFKTYFYGMGGTMEPAYDADSYPNAVDWRDIGAVTEVRSQGNCGACWAITAVETVESAVFIAKGTLYDLSETEIIVCAEECEMCAGGWPQDAFEYIMDNKGVPLTDDIPYDADWLLQISEAVAGDSDELNADTVKEYRQQTCPSGHDGGHSGSGDGVQGENTFSRYGYFEGYGYATDKCACYTDGSGCDCDKQNEGLAVRNLATYGPAVVCLDASTWQDYSDGIITADSGCSSGFMDVNHCVQAVGYAFFNGDDEKEGGGSGSGDHSGSRDSKSGSRDSSNRQGYWIVRNQWSDYWGMSGYAYVAMGDNTCGILNDMIQVYT